jgi:hypothetical protein
MNCIDPAVTDESDPLQTDESLSAFNGANGWKRPPESSSYAEEFLTRYRKAQRERVAKIDAFAKAQVASRAEARKRSKESPNRADAILAAYSPIFTIWRTVRPRLWHAVGRQSDRFELRQCGLCARLHAGELAVELVGAIVKRVDGSLRAGDQPTDLDDRIYRR